MSKHIFNSSIEPSSLQSQDDLSSNFHHIDARITSLLELNEAEQKVLFILSEFDGINAKGLGRKAGMPVYKAWSTADKLIKAKLLGYEKVKPIEEGLIKAYKYHLAPDLSKEAIKAAFNKTELGSLLFARSEVVKQEPTYLSGKRMETIIKFALLELLKYTNNPSLGNIPTPHRSGCSYADLFNIEVLEQKGEFFFLLHRIMTWLELESQIILQVIAKNGEITSDEIRDISNVELTVEEIYPYIKELYSKHLIVVKESLSNNKINYKYALVPGLTKELVNASIYCRYSGSLPW